MFGGGDDDDDEAALVLQLFLSLSLSTPVSHTLSLYFSISNAMFFVEPCRVSMGPLKEEL